MPKADPERYLARARRLAARRGGRLLSRRYVNDTANLDLKCAHGHRFLMSSGKLVSGQWCRTCGRERAASRRRPAMEARLRQILARRGGRLLSPGYLNNSTKLRYRCGQGHEWEAVPASLFVGLWCPGCAQQEISKTRRLAVEGRLRALAKRTGQELLPPGFVGARTRIVLRCPRGHLWRVPYLGFEQGTRCPRCRQEDLLQAMHRIAERWGGACLARSVRDAHQTIWWRCAQGHRFAAPAERARRGIWCPRCRSFPAGDLARMRRIASARGGECLSPGYVNTDTKLSWRCREGHEWRAKPSSIVQGTWCRVCRLRGGHSLKLLTIGVMQEMARQRGGACLSREYHGSMKHLRWRCARGHTWWALPSRVQQGDWCPVCAHRVPGSLVAMRGLAAERGGRCLSRSWDDHSQPLHFECSHGHRFRMNGNVVKSGAWCPTCAGSETGRPR